MTPRVAVVTSCWGHARYLADAILSVRAQTMADFEHVVVIDGPQDGHPLAIAETLADEDARLRVLVNLDRRGNPYCQNAGARCSTAPWILKVDADDTIEPGYLAAIVAAADADRALNVIFSECHVWHPEHPERDEVFSYPAFAPSRMADVFMIPGPAAVHRTLWDAVGGWAEPMSCADDWDFFVRAQVAVGLRVHQIPAPLWHYRQHDGPRMSRDARALPEYQARWRQLLGVAA